MSKSIARKRAEPATKARKELADTKREWAVGRKKSNTMSGIPSTPKRDWNSHNSNMDYLEAKQTFLKKKGHPKPVSPRKGASVGRQKNLSRRSVMQLWR